MGNLLLSKKETADALGISIRTIDNLIVGKELAVRRVGRRVLIPVSEVQRFTRHDHETRPAAKPNPLDSADQDKRDSLVTHAVVARSNKR
jgi:excisionase family DNA binding protein